jgi:hypothetical protein
MNNWKSGIYKAPRMEADAKSCEARLVEAASKRSCTACNGAECSEEGKMFAGRISRAGCFSLGYVSPH